MGRGSVHSPSRLFSASSSTPPSCRIHLHASLAVLPPLVIPPCLALLGNALALLFLCLAPAFGFLFRSFSSSHLCLSLSCALCPELFPFLPSLWPLAVPSATELSLAVPGILHCLSCHYLLCLHHTFYIRCRNYFSFANLAPASFCKYWSPAPYPYIKLTAAFRIFFFTPKLKKMGYSVNFTCDSLTVS